MGQKVTCSNWFLVQAARSTQKCLTQVITDAQESERRGRNKDANEINFVHSTAIL